MNPNDSATPQTTGARALFRAVLAAERPAFATAALASLLANLVALAGSLYSMQVYDRVIPTQGLSTLTVLTVGALAACVFELVIKMTRSRILEASVRSMDEVLSHGIFARLLAIRIDQLPPGIGSVSAQVRSYESIRAFASSATMYIAVDAPFGLLFLGVMWMLAGIELVLVPALFFVVAVGVGVMYRARIARHAGSASAAGNRKAGLLVETIENAEAIKAMGTQPRQSEQWDTLSKQAIDDELAIKHLSESSSHFAGFVQQTSYIVMIGVGANNPATSSALTTGGLIACSILSGRVLAPIGMLPGLIVQWAHAKIALANLERIYALECDNHGIERPLEPARLHGALRVENVSFAYRGRPPCVTVGKLEIRAGEKLAILGPVGAGKSTLLKLLAGLYKPAAGRVLIDDLELQQIARAHLSRSLGYLPQDVRLALSGHLGTALGLIGGLLELVKVYDNGTLLGSASVSGGTDWSFNTGTLSTGSHSFSVRVESVLGAYTVANGASVTVAASDPLVTASDSSYNGSALAKFSVAGSATLLDLTKVSGAGQPHMDVVSLGQASNTLKLGLADVLQGSTDSFTSANGWAGLTASGKHQLLVDGSSGTVTMTDATWASVGTVTHAGNTYNVYEDSTHLAQLLVDTHLTRTGPIGG
jgi:ABC-type protease/lipase transport system fused ATPase/permease subunit